MKQPWLFNQITGDLQLVEKELLKFIETDYPLLKESSVHLLSARGKRLRPAFAILAGKLFNCPLERLIPLAMALELIHMASLVHDDVVDASVTRRGRPTVKAEWGNVVSVATGDYLFAKSLVLISQIDNPEISRIFAEVSIEMCQGEIQQLKCSFDTHQTAKQYYYRIKRKTALLISASCRLGGLVSGASRREIWALGAYGNALGIAFQIVDDILDLTAKSADIGKPIGGDLRQGIMTLPMILALQSSPHSQELELLLAKHDKSEEELWRAVDLIRESGAIEESMRWVDRYVDKAKRHLRELPGGPTRSALDKLAEFVRVRSF